MAQHPDNKVSTYWPESVSALVQVALAEDIGSGDLTTEAVVPPGAFATARIEARETGVVAGLPIAQRVFQAIDPALGFMSLVKEGGRVNSGDVLIQLEGNAAAILMGERTALNFLQRLSGIASITAQHVAACAGTRARIVDTRKTPPGFRLLDKYAVRMGGGANHRTGLFDGILIKENHIRVAGGVAAAISAARRRAPHLTCVEIECDTLDQVDEAVAAGADVILLDNMTNEQMAEAVRRIGDNALTEASGNMSLQRIPEVAATGVDLISVGALTHSVRALDLSLEVTHWRLP